MKLWLPNKYRLLAEKLSEDLDEAQSELEIERTKRIAAEALSQEREKALKQAYEGLLRAETARDEAVRERLQSVNLVNTALLQSLAPDRPSADPKQFKAIAKPQVQSVPRARIAEHKFMSALFKMERDRRSPAPAVQPDVAEKAG